MFVENKHGKNHNGRLYFKCPVFALPYNSPKTFINMFPSMFPLPSEFAANFPSIAYINILTIPKQKYGTNNSLIFLIKNVANFSYLFLKSIPEMKKNKGI